MSYHHQTQEQNFEYLSKYREHVASLDLPIQEMDALINIVHSILSYFVDQAFNVQTDQITLQSVGKISLNMPTIDHVTNGNHYENQTVDARVYGAESDASPLGASQP